MTITYVTSGSLELHFFRSIFYVWFKCQLKEYISSTITAEHLEKSLKVAVFLSAHCPQQMRDANQMMEEE